MQNASKHFKSAEITTFCLNDDGTFPNHPRWPLLVYQHAVKLPTRNPAALIEQILGANHWTNSWRNGIFTFQHYHSTAHEVLAVYSGTAKVQLGGPSGIITDIHPGDVLILPAGTAHKNLGASADFGVVGAYPEGQEMDMCYGKAGERPQTDRNIQQVPKPKTDPIYGASGPLLELWK
jgi:uncharacterized protein YjlB